MLRAGVGNLGTASPGLYFRTMGQDIIGHIQSIHLEGFLESHPRIGEILTCDPPVKLELHDPLSLLSAESTYNQNAFSYVCQVAGTVGEQASYPYRHLVASNVLAAASVQEGGMPKRDFLDPHSSLRLWMVKTVEEWAGKPAPKLAFAEEACVRMGEAYLWRGERVPKVADRHAAMLGAHFASEYLAAQQEFPTMVALFQTEAPELLQLLRDTREPHFGFSAADWIEGHPAVEVKHAGFAARAAEAACWQMDEVTLNGFWESFYAGFEEFCKNDQQYFLCLADIA